ncbi:MAG: lipopolysaccharide biosynthesis protein [Armatimonadota bacterium]
MTEERSSSSADNIGARARSAAGWQLLSNGINTALQMVTSIVLARLLMPADFGIVAMASMVTGLAAVFQDLGLGQALVQRQEITRAHTRSAFWGTLVMGLALWGAVFLAAPYVSRYFHEPRMVPVLRLISLTFVLSPFAVVPRSLLQRELDFRTPFFAGLTGSLAYGGVGITMALLDYGYWALVGAALAGALLNTAALCILTRHLPPLIPTFRGIADLYRFGVGATGVGIGHYIATKIDYFAIGRRLDAGALGLYTRAYSFVTYPALLSGTVAPVFFPAFSRIQQDRARMRSAYGRLTTLMATVFFPVLVLAIISAPELIPTVLGEQWTASVVPAQILTLIGMCKITSSAAGAVIKAAGRVYSEAWRQLLYGTLIGVGAWFAAPHGIVAVAVAVTCANAVHYTLIGHLVWLAVGFGITDYARAFRGPLVATLIGSAIALLCRSGAIAAGYDAAAVLALTVAPAALATCLLTWRLPFPETQNAFLEIRAFCRRGLSLVR